MAEQGDNPGDNSPPSTNGGQTAPEPAATVPELAAAGRGARGRFAPGNPGGPGNPLAAEVGKHRARLFKAARAKDVNQALATIREVMTDPDGKASDRLAAAKLLLDRLLGPALELDLLERLEALEATIFREENHGTR